MVFLMTGLTLAEIAEQLGITTYAAQKRLQRSGILPQQYAGPTAFYGPEVVDAIRDTPPPGRPKSGSSPK